MKLRSPIGTRTGFLFESLANVVINKILLIQGVSEVRTPSGNFWTVRERKTKLWECFWECFHLKRDHQQRNQACLHRYRRKSTSKKINGWYLVKKLIFYKWQPKSNVWSVRKDGRKMTEIRVSGAHWTLRSMVLELLF